jgi:putative aldouronate transport system permease protein
VDPELHEAGQVDGMTRFQRLLHIDLPAIVPTITILMILNVGRSMNIGFEKIYLMQNDLNLSASEVISTYTYKVGLNVVGGNFSYATAIGLFNSVINLGLITLVNFISGRLGETSLW